MKDEPARPAQIPLSHGTSHRQVSPLAIPTKMLAPTLRKTSSLWSLGPRQSVRFGVLNSPPSPPPCPSRVGGQNTDTVAEGSLPTSPDAM